MGSTARSLATSGERDDVYRRLADELSACRSRLERLLAVAVDQASDTPVPDHSDVDASVRALFTDPAKPDTVREPDAWAAIIERSRDRFVGPQGRELTDAFNGIAAANQLALLATRVSVLVRGVNQDPQDTAVVAVRPIGGPMRPGAVPSDRSRQAGGVELPGAEIQPRAALDGAADGRRSDQAARADALASAGVAVDRGAARSALPVDAAACRRPRADRTARRSAACAVGPRRAVPDDRSRRWRACDERRATRRPSHRRSSPIPPIRSFPTASGCPRSTAPRRSSRRRNQVTRARLERVLAEIDKIGADVEAPPEQDPAAVGALRKPARRRHSLRHQRSARRGDAGRKIARCTWCCRCRRELMRYPWELLRDRHGWLVERFAIGRQVIADAERAPRWSSSPRQGPLRLLVVAPSVPGGGAEAAGRRDTRRLPRGGLLRAAARPSAGDDRSVRLHDACGPARHG